MLAVVGFIATDFVRLPGEYYSFEAVPKTADAHDALFASGPMWNLLLWIGLFDLVVTAPAVQAMGQGEREAGGKLKIILSFLSHFDDKICFLISNLPLLCTSLLL